jgi:hypothetical protein
MSCKSEIEKAIAKDIESPLCDVVSNEESVAAVLPIETASTRSYIL